jgi:hypothetical protein
VGDNSIIPLDYNASYFNGILNVKVRVAGFDPCCGWQEDVLIADIPFLIFGRTLSYFPDIY